MKKEGEKWNDVYFKNELLFKEEEEEEEKKERDEGRGR